jgi:hypothetical protein
MPPLQSSSTGWAAVHVGMLDRGMCLHAPMPCVLGMRRKAAVAANATMDFLTELVAPAPDLPPPDADPQEQPKPKRRRSVYVARVTPYLVTTTVRSLEGVCACAPALPHGIWASCHTLAAALPRRDLQ